jgi:competence CoiA-like predicted nuclease
MESAKSILLNEEFTPDDDRLNYQSYVNFLLTCNVCGEAVFLKQPSDFNKSGRKRAAHFSHFKDTGKNDCWLRTESNTNTRDTDSEGKKQSLVNY